MTLHGVTIYEEGGATVDDNHRLTLAQACDLFIRAQARVVSPGTLHTYRNARLHLMRHFGADFPILELTRASMMEWRDSLFDVTSHETHPYYKPESGYGGQLSPATMRRIIGTASALFNWLVSMQLLPVNPLKGVRRPRMPQQPPKGIEESDFSRMLKAAREYTGVKIEYAPMYVARALAILWFLNDTGCRVGGLVSASLDTLTVFEDGAICDVTEKGRNGKRTRPVYLSETAALALLEWVDLRPKCDHRRIFCAIEGKSAGQPMTESGVRQMLKRLGQRAGAKGYTRPHSFRHAAGRRWTMNGASLAEVQQMLGHASPSTTAQFYARFNNDELRRKHKKVNG